MAPPVKSTREIAASWSISPKPARDGIPRLARKCAAGIPLTRALSDWAIARNLKDEANTVGRPFVKRPVDGDLLKDIATAPRARIDFGGADVSQRSTTGAKTVPKATSNKRPIMAAAVLRSSDLPPKAESPPR